MTTSNQTAEIVSVVRPIKRSLTRRFWWLIAAIAVLIVVAGWWSSMIVSNRPLFTVTLPDSQHWVSTVGPRSGTGPWANRVSVVQPDNVRSHGMVPPATQPAWSRWLVVRVLESVDSATPRYYFVDQTARQAVGPWSPGKKVYLETFDPTGRFVVFARDSFLSYRSITKSVHTFDPATRRAAKYSLPTSDRWQECFSLDGTTLATSRGGDKSPLKIDLIDLRDGVTKRTLDFPERNAMSAKPGEREGYGREWDLSPDGGQLALSRHWMEDDDSNAIEIWDTESGQLKQKVEVTTVFGETLTAISFSPDGNDLVIEITSPLKSPLRRRFNLKTQDFQDEFNPWEGIQFKGFHHRGFHVGLVGLDGRHMLWVRHPMPPAREDFFEWEIRVTDLEGKVLRDWRRLPDSVARRIDDRLDARIVPNTEGVVIMNPQTASISWYDWKSDNLRRLAGTHKKHDQVDFFAVQPGRVSLIYRESNSDIKVKVFAPQ